MMRLIAIVFALAAADICAGHVAPLISRTAWSHKSAKHAVPVCTWSMVPACVLPPAGTPPDVRLECEHWWPLS